MLMWMLSASRLVKTAAAAFQAAFAAGALAPKLVSKPAVNVGVMTSMLIGLLCGIGGARLLRGSRRRRRSVVDADELEPQIQICAPVDLEPQQDVAVVLRGDVEDAHAGRAPERLIELSGRPLCHLAEGREYALGPGDPDTRDVERECSVSPDHPVGLSVLGDCESRDPGHDPSLQAVAGEETPVAKPCCCSISGAAATGSSCC